MKKIFYFILITILGFIETGNSQIIMTTNLDLDPVNSSYDLTAYPNSTTYPNQYELNMHLSVLVNTGQYGKFAVTSYKRSRSWNNAAQTWGTWGSWGGFTPNINVFPNLGPSQQLSSTYSGTARTTQYEGTQIEYYVTVTFTATNGGGTKTVNTPTRTATILGVPKPCFSMYNVESTTTEPSYYGNINIKNICINAVTINGSCTEFENGYYIGVSEFNKDNWTFGSDVYNDWVSATGEAPSFISLNALAASKNKAFVPGKLYIVNLSVGPVWKSAEPQFFRVVNCKNDSQIDQPIDTETTAFNYEDQKNTKVLKLYPNPAKDILTISLENDDKIVSYVIYNNSGIAVKKVSLGDNVTNQVVDIKDLEKGIYFIGIETTKTIFKEKLVKE